VAIFGGTTHTPTRDNAGNVCFVPKDMRVEGNVWAIHHNDRKLSEPVRFDSNWFIGNIDRPFPDRVKYIAYWTDRPSCPEETLAEQWTFISACRLV
ncbi:hypothetical protein BKA63DRAFT_430054, partial [Paraphoma chrysanthemicola]